MMNCNPFLVLVWTLLGGLTRYDESSYYCLKFYAIGKVSRE